LQLEVAETAKGFAGVAETAREVAGVLREVAETAREVAGAGCEGGRVGRGGLQRNASIGRWRRLEQCLAPPKATL